MDGYVSYLPIIVSNIFVLFCFSCASSGFTNTANYEQLLAHGRLPLVHLPMHSCSTLLTLSQPESVQYEGTFHKFMFETGEENEKLFAPVFSTAVSRDPLSGMLISKQFFTVA